MNVADQSPPLEFATIDQIMDELHKRHPGAVLGLRTDEGNNDEGTQFYWRGGRCAAIGLLAEGQIRLTHLPPDRIAEEPE